MNKISEKAQTLYTNAKLVSHFLNENVNIAYLLSE